MLTVGSDTTITSAGGVITIVGWTTAQLSSDDFSFV